MNITGINPGDIHSALSVIPVKVRESHSMKRKKNTQIHMGQLRILRKAL